MDEIIEKSYFSYFSFLPFRFDNKVGFIISLITFLILNMTSMLFMTLMALGNALGGWGHSWNSGEYFGYILVMFIVIMLIYIPIIKFKNTSKSYNIYSIIFVIIFVNTGYLAYFTF